MFLVGLSSSSPPIISRGKSNELWSDNCNMRSLMIAGTGVKLRLALDHRTQTTFWSSLSAIPLRELLVTGSFYMSEYHVLIHILYHHLHLAHHYSDLTWGKLKLELYCHHLSKMCEYIFRKFLCLSYLIHFKASFYKCSHIQSWNNCLVLGTAYNIMVLDAMVLHENYINSIYVALFYY